MPTAVDISPIIPFKKLKNTKAWKLTSEYVRKSSGGKCYTCGKKYPLAKLVAGHFIEKIGGAAVYFDLRNLRAQCGWNCNRMKHGNKEIYAMKLVKERGPNILQELHKKAQKSKQWHQNELDDIAAEMYMKLHSYRPDLPKAA